MWPFRRKKTQNAEHNIPADIQQYYQPAKKQRPWMAWLLAIGTLIVTVVLAVGLFFGGRWAYRKIAHKDQPQTASESNTNNNSDNNSNNNSSQSPTTTPPPSNTTPNPNPAPSAPTVLPGAPTTPSTPQDQSQLPHTGPNGDD